MGLLIQAVYCMGALIDRQFCVWQRCEPELDLIQTPYQHLGPLVFEAAARARTKAAQGTKTLNRGLEEIGGQVTLSSRKTMSTEHQAMLRTIQCGGGISKIELQAMGAAQAATCDYCGHHLCDMDHIPWQCPQSRTARTEADAGLARVGAKLMNPAVRRGIAPAMKSGSNIAFWGLGLNRIDGANHDTLKLFGCTPQEDRDVQRCLDDAKLQGKNARQLMACIRGGFGTGGSPTFPLQVDGEIPDEPSGYTDGGLANPSTQWWALGGFGVWWPQQEADTSYCNEVLQQQYAHQDVTEKGIGLWGKMAGQRNSSTRMEIAGSIIAMSRATPLRIAADSKSMIDKAMRLKRKAVEWNAELTAAWWPRRNPMGKPWGLQPDGDLWKLVWEGLLTRGPKTGT